MTSTMIFGYGYLGRRVADLAVAAGDNVWATTRQASKFRQMRGRSIRPLEADWTDRRTLGRLPEVDRVLISVSYDRESKRCRYDSQVGGLANLLAVLSPQTDVCYISTTGVFHQTDGRWVDETSPAHPIREGGRVHLQAESMLHRTRPRSPWTVLRFSGIYGPGRVPRAADVKGRRPIELPKDGYLNLIHVDDGAAAVMAAWQQSQRRLYLVSDDEPMRRTDFYRQIANELRVPQPRFIEPEPVENLSPRARSDSNKRIWNRRMKSDLVPRLKFPTYREGLVDVL